MANNSVSRQIKAYEIREYPLPDADNVVPAGTLRMDPTDPHEWHERFSGLEHADRLFEGSASWLMHMRTSVGSVNGASIAALSRVRAGEGGLGVIDVVDGNYAEIALGDNTGLAEETHMAFFENNVLLAVSNGQGAPGSNRIEEFFNGVIDWGPDRRVAIVPLSPGQEARMRAIDEFNSYTREAVTRLPANRWERIPEDASWYRETMRSAAETFGPEVRVGLVVKVPTRDARESGQALYEQWKNVATLPENEQSSVKFSHSETNRNRTINLVHDVVAITKDVTVEQDDADGAARIFNEMSTSRAIGAAYDELLPLIEASLDATDTDD